MCLFTDIIAAHFTLHTSYSKYIHTYIQHGDFIVKSQLLHGVCVHFGTICVCCAFVHLMAQFVLMHPAGRGKRAHTEKLLALPYTCLNLCWTFAIAQLWRAVQFVPESQPWKVFCMGASFCRVVHPVKSSSHSCFSICAQLRHNLHNCAEQFNLCKRARPENFQWKADVLLLHGCELLHPACCKGLNNLKSWQCTSMCFFIYFSFSCLCPHSSQAGLLHGCELLQGAHPGCCTGLNKLNAGDASVILEHQAVRIP